MRRVEGAVWYEAQLVAPREGPGGLFHGMSWSPKSDQLLFLEERAQQLTSVGIASPLPDGSVSTTTLDGSIRAGDQVAAEWSPTGDRIALGLDAGLEHRIFIHDVGQGSSAAPWPVREVVPPAGTIFDTLPMLPAARISSDGRWIAAGLMGPDQTSKRPRTVNAFPTDGKGEAREMTACVAFSPDGSSDWCVPWSWHPQGATLLVLRRRGEAPNVTLEAWSPDSGSHTPIIDAEPTRWLTPHSTRFVAQAVGSRMLSIVDVRDVSSPVIVNVPTSELRSLERAMPSPDGRWLALLWRSDGEWAGVEVNAAWLEDVALEINRATD
jgi:hypothetical protein